MCSYSESEEWKLIKKECQEEKENGERLTKESEERAIKLHESEETISQFRGICDSNGFVHDACVVFNRVVELVDYIDNHTVMKPSEMNREVKALKAALGRMSYDTKKVIGLDVFMLMDEKLKSYKPLPKKRGLLSNEIIKESFELFTKYNVDADHLVDFVMLIIDPIYDVNIPFDIEKAVYDYKRKLTKGGKLKINS